MSRSIRRWWNSRVIWFALAWPEVGIGQVIMRHHARRLVEVEARLVQGTAGQREALALPDQKLHRSSIERLNATFRARLHGLVRRGRALYRQTPALQAGMYLVGTCYNFCCFHHSLRQEQRQARRKWVARTPAMAAGITDHRWSLKELLTYQSASPPYVPPKRRGRKPKQACPPVMGAALGRPGILGLYPWAIIVRYKSRLSLLFGVCSEFCLILCL